MIAVRLNGQERRLEGDPTVGSLIESLGLSASRVAVERNRRIVSRGDFSATRLADGDVIEIVHLVGGG